MKTLENGMQCEVLKVFRNASNKTKEVNGITVFTDLLKVKLSDGKVKVICETELNKQDIMNITAKQIKTCYVYTKNGYTISYSGGLYNFSALYNSGRFKTLKEVKKEIKSL